MFIIIGGATGTGKSKVAIELAKNINGEIISADSMQVYKGMDIGTYKITENERKEINHYMIDIIVPEESYSAARFKKEAENIMDTIKAKGKLPIITGGTGLYINAIINGLFEAKEPDERLKARLRQELAEKGLKYLINEVKRLDSEALDGIDLNNPRRILRLLGLVLANRRKISELKNETAKTAYRDKYLLFVLDIHKEKLYERINTRVDEMMKAGLEGEVKSLLDSGIDSNQTSMQAIGYKEIAAYLKSKTGLKEAVEIIKKNTRNYAKRQVTWFKRYKEAIWVDATDKKVYDIVDEIEKEIHAYFKA